jgi:predicted lipoprotein with Yx(FWY)xxD motif
MSMRKTAGVGVVVAFVLAACGGHSNGTGGGSPNGPAGGGKGAAVLTVNTGDASGVGTVLVNAEGLTLYHWKGETTSSLQCTGSCTSTWIPLKVTGGGSPTGGMHVTGTLDTFSRSDGGGDQVTYNGMPLYTYTGDSKPGEASGQGIGGVWYAVTPSAAGGGGQPSPSSSGYGY